MGLGALRQGGVDHRAVPVGLEAWILPEGVVFVPDCVAALLFWCFEGDSLWRIFFVAGGHFGGLGVVDVAVAPRFLVIAAH